MAEVDFVDQVTEEPSLAERKLEFTIEIFKFQTCSVCLVFYIGGGEFVGHFKENIINLSVLTSVLSINLCYM